MKDSILYREIKSVKAGNIQRFEINYTPEKEHQLSFTSNLWVKVKNREAIPMRAAFIAGPYLLYVDCRLEDYDPKKKCFVTADQPLFEPQLQPGKSFYSELACHRIKPLYKWTVDVVAQILFSNSISIDFEITIGTSKDVLQDSSFVNADKLGLFTPPSTLHVNSLDTFDLWNLPIPNVKKPIHLVILTHGLHSNVSADLLYLKEQIDNHKGSENISVKGYFGNICKTERGIKYLGSRVAEFIVDLVTNNEIYNNGKVAKISFIGHSLGGLVQTFAIAYLQNNFPWFFSTIKPINFITVAAPMLGASNDNPIYINLALLAGIVGRTGQDLSLRFLDEQHAKPLLLLLPSGPTHQVLKRFLRRTVYANVVNDGVVPLRTSALLYLDYKGLSTALSKESIVSHHLDKAGVNKIPDDNNNNKSLDNSGGVEDISSYLPQPVQMFLTKFMPQKQYNPEVFSRYQTNADSESIDEDEDTSGSKTKAFLKAAGKLPKASVLETAASLILPPLPPLKYIIDPESRNDVVIYDKVYHETDLPAKDDIGNVEIEPHNQSSSNEGNVNAFKKRFLSNIDFDEFEKREEQIAREYHNQLSWRKVLVKLEADAHNNIIVRRRFSNAFGWKVVNHIVENHFGLDDDEEHERMSGSGWKLDKGLGLINDDSLDDEMELKGILSRELITRENDDIDKKSKENPDDHKWINSIGDDSFFSVGPAGLLSDVSEMMTGLRDQWYTSKNSQINSDKLYENKDTNDEYEKDIQTSSMGDFF